MRKLAKLGAFLFIGATLSAGLVSCNNEYPTVVTPPAVEETHTISGMITDRQGNPLEGVTVKATGTTESTVTTQSNGYYIFPDVEVGSYTVTASATGRLEASTTAVISNTSDGMNAVWNVMLLKEDAGTKIDVSNGAAAEGSLITESIVGNEEGQVEIGADVPADALDDASEDISIVMIPVYTEEDAESRAVESTMLIGASLEASKPNAKLKNGKTVKMTFKLDEATVNAVTVKKYNGSNWVVYNDVNVKKNGKMIDVYADELSTVYGLFADVNFVETISNVAITFNPATVDNLTGNAPVRINDSKYSYGVGTELTLNAGTSKLRALLIEAIATRYGANFQRINNASYPINVDLPISCRFAINGKQEIKNISATVANTTANAKSYGDVEINVNMTTVGDHSGGIVGR